MLILIEDKNYVLGGKKIIKIICTQQFSKNIVDWTWEGREPENVSK